MIEAMIVMRHKDGRFGWVSTEMVTPEQLDDLDHHLGLEGFVCTLQKNSQVLYFSRAEKEYIRVDCKYIVRHADNMKMLMGHNCEVFEIDEETSIVKTKKGYYVVK